MSQHPQTHYDSLINDIQKYDHAYYVEARSLIPDAQYDALMRTIREIECVHPEWIRPDSPTRRVGNDLQSGFSTHAHVTPMLSLDNIFEMEDLEKRLAKWIGEGSGRLGNLPFVVEPKIDGLSLDLCYENGLLVRATTRGDGHFGDVVTANVATIRSVPLKLRLNKFMTHYLPVLHIRGEVFMTFKDFVEVNRFRVERNQEPLANPRNGAAGALKQHDAKECAARRLSFIPYHLAAWTEDYAVPGEQLHLWPWLAELGFRPLGVEEVNAFADIDAVLNWVTRFEASKKLLPYPTDGAVIKLNRFDARQIFGQGERAVRWGYAYKYAPDTADTRLNSITIQVGRSGVLTPVAELEPVELAGTTVKRASLHNQDVINSLQLTVGDIVKVEKAGEIIPQVLSVVTPSGDATYQLPKYCPSCGTPVIRAVVGEEGSEEGAAIVCPNTKNCNGQLIARLVYWCSKPAMEIEDVGESMLRELFAVGVLYPWNLYALNAKVIFNCGFGETQSKNAAEAIRVSKDRGLDRVLIGLGIPRVGTSTARKLARAFPDMAALMSAPVEQFQKIVGLNESTIQAIRTWVTDADNVQQIAWLGKVGVSLVSKTYSPQVATGAFAGKVVVFTGELASMKREQAQSLVEGQGGRCTSSVSSRTSCVVVGSEPGENKIRKATELSIPMLAETEFLRLLKNE